VQNYNVKIRGQTYSYALYDTQGFDRNPGILSLAQFQSYSAFLIVYDISDYRSFMNAKQCIEEIKEHCRPENQYMIVLGNKNDLP